MGNYDKKAAIEIGAITALEHEQELLRLGLSQRHRVVNYLIQSEQHLGHFERPGQGGFDPYEKLAFDLTLEEAIRFTLIKDGVIRAAHEG